MEETKKTNLMTIVKPQFVYDNTKDLFEQVQDYIIDNLFDYLMKRIKDGSKGYRYYKGFYPSTNNPLPNTYFNTLNKEEFVGGFYGIISNRPAPHKQSSNEPHKLTASGTYFLYFRNIALVIHIHNFARALYIQEFNHEYNLELSSIKDIFGVAGGMQPWFDSVIESDAIIRETRTVLSSINTQLSALPFSTSNYHQLYLLFSRILFLSYDNKMSYRRFYDILEDLNQKSKQRRLVKSIDELKTSVERTKNSELIQTVQVIETKNTKLSFNIGRSLNIQFENKTRTRNCFSQLDKRLEEDRIKQRQHQQFILIVILLIALASRLF